MADTAAGLLLTTGVASARGALLAICSARVDAISELENALGAELLRAGLLGGARPKIAGRYIVERFLGRGATGLVVAALDDRLGRPVALKLGIAAADTTMLAEARALALLDHPNVVRVHDVDFGSAVFDGKPFRLWLVSMQRVEAYSPSEPLIRHALSTAEPYATAPRSTILTSRRVPGV